jgi:hypothetical protein
VTRQTRRSSAVADGSDEEIDFIGELVIAAAASGR